MLTALALNGFSQDTNTIQYFDFEKKGGSNTSIDNEKNLISTFNGVTKSFPYFTNTKIKTSTPLISIVEHYDGDQSIRYMMSDAFTSSKNERSQHLIQDNLPFDSTLFFGFALKIHSDTDQPNKDIIFFQLSQGDNIPFPLALKLVPGGEKGHFNYTLERRNYNATNGKLNPVILYDSSIAQGEWHSFVLAVNLNTSGKKAGLITLWYDNIPVFSNFAGITYDPKISIAGVLPSNKIQAFIGPNREQDDTNVKVFYDEVKYAKNYYSAVPKIKLQFNQTKNVLFIGNSYTHREIEQQHEYKSQNLLPEMISSIAASTGNQLQYVFRTDGGHTLRSHAKSDDVLDRFEDNSLNAINKKGWHYIVLQEASDRPSNTKEAGLYYDAVRDLADTIRRTNPAAQIILYQTWAQKNGIKEDIQNGIKGCKKEPFECFKEMDSLNNITFTKAADDYKTDLSPVGAVIRYLREQDSKFNTYIGDGSHPNKSGTYAAACTFYTIIFRKDPSLITFNGGLDQKVADVIRSATKKVVYNNLNNWVRDTLPASTYCNFSTPLDQPLSTMQVSSSRAYVLGKGGPDLTSLYQLEFDWNKDQNALNVFTLYTKEKGQFKYYDLRLNNNTFEQASPYITIANSNFPGLDGDYFVNTTQNINGEKNLILVSATKGYTLYFTNSTSTPTCETKILETPLQSALAITETIDGNIDAPTITLSPNPAKEVVQINTSISLKGYQAEYAVEVTNTLGEVFDVPYAANENNITLNLRNLQSGMYLVKLSSGEFQIIKKIMVEK